jgi:hypothetical protein
MKKIGKGNGPPWASAGRGRSKNINDIGSTKTREETARTILHTLPF